MNLLKKSWEDLFQRTVIAIERIHRTDPEHFGQEWVEASTAASRRMADNQDAWLEYFVISLEAKKIRREKEMRDAAARAGGRPQLPGAGRRVSL